MTTTVNQPTPAPTNKVAAAGVGGVVSAVVLALCDALGAFDLGTFWDAIIPAVSAFASGYITKERRNVA